MDYKSFGVFFAALNLFLSFYDLPVLLTIFLLVLKCAEKTSAALKLSCGNFNMLTSSQSQP